MNNDFNNNLNPTGFNPDGQQPNNNMNIDMNNGMNNNMMGANVAPVNPVNNFGAPVPEVAPENNMSAPVPEVAPANDMGAPVPEVAPASDMGAPVPEAAPANVFGTPDPMPTNPANEFGTPNPMPTNPANEFGTPNPMNNFEQPQYNAPQEPAPSEDKPKKSPVAAIIVGIIVALAVGFGVYYFFFREDKTVNVYDGGNTSTTQTTTTSDTTSSDSVVTYKGYQFKKETGFTYAEKSSGLSMTSSSEIFYFTVLNAKFDSVPADKLKTELEKTGYTITDYNKGTYAGYPAITCNVYSNGIKMFYALTATSDGANVMQVMGTSRSGVPTSGMLEKGIKYAKAATYTGNSSSFASDTEVNPNFTDLLQEVQLNETEEATVTETETETETEIATETETENVGE